MVPVPISRCAIGPGRVDISAIHLIKAPVGLIVPPVIRKGFLSYASYRFFFSFPDFSDDIFPGSFFPGSFEV
jgi:hypothetical protein